MISSASVKFMALDRKKGYISEVINNFEADFEYLFRQYNLICFSINDSLTKWNSMFEQVKSLSSKYENRGVIAYVPEGDILVFPKTTYADYHWVKSIVKDKMGNENIKVIFTGADQKFVQVD